MNSLDFLFYSFFPRQRNAPPSVLYGSSSQVALLTSFWIWMLVSGMYLSISIFYRNSLADLFVNTNWALMILAGIVGGLMKWRYCFFISYESLVAKRQKIRYIWIHYIINALILIGAPILAFVAFRFYKYGYV